MHNFASLVTFSPYVFSACYWTFMNKKCGNEMERHDNQDFATQVFMRKNFYSDSFENSNALESRYVYNKRYI